MAEVVENTFMEGKILWLAQAIMQSLSTGEPAECIRQFDLAENIEKLKFEIKGVEMVVAALKGRVIGNKPLANVFARLKELMYHADDAVSELDYYLKQQQHQAEGVVFASANQPEDTDGDGTELSVMDGSSGNHDIPTSKPRRNLSPEWKHFIPIRNGRVIHKAECKYCGSQVRYGGTSGMKRHIKNWSCLARCPTGYRPPNHTSDVAPYGTTDANHGPVARKRMRLELDKASIWGRIHKVALDLHDIQGILNGFIKDHVAGSNYSQSTIVSNNDAEGTGRDASEQSSSDKFDIPSSKSRTNRCKEWDHFIPVTDCNWTKIGAKCKYCRDVVIKCGCTTGMKGLKTHSKSKKCQKNRPADDQPPNPASTRILGEGSNVDHLSGILKNEERKSLQLSRGGTTDLKLTYDRLPYHLQQCFFYCSIFPKNYTFTAEDLILTWISQGFMRCMNSSKIPEEIGREYLTELVKLGIFKQAQREIPSDQTCYVMPDAMHDFARLISRTECAVIDGTECNGMLPTIRHLSILTDSAYYEDQHGNLIRNLKFEEKLRGVVTSAWKLRTLVLIGRYDSFFFQSFQDVFQEAPYLRMLQISLAYADSHSFECKLVNSTHLRYLKLERKRGMEASLQGFEDSSSMDDDNSSQSSEPITDTELDEHSLSMDDDNSIQSSEPLIDTEIEGDSSPVNDDNNNQSSEHVIDTARAVLEGLQPCDNLKHLRVSGYTGATSPAWLGTSVTCLQTVHLEDCGEWKILPSLGRLPFLTKLELRNMRSVIEVSLPSLEELVLMKMPKLERCVCNSISELNSRIKVLKIGRCRVLKAFPLFECCEKLKIEHRSWLPRLNKLTMYKCPCLTVSNPLPPSSKVCELDIAGVSTLPTMYRSTYGELIIGDFDIPEDLNNLTELDSKILSFHNLRAITRMQIAYCQNLSYSSFKSFGQLKSLNSLLIYSCENLFSSDVLPEHVHEDMAATNSIALPSLKHLHIDECGITGMWLSMILQHAPSLEELNLDSCRQLSVLVIEGKESSLSNHTSTPLASSPGNADDVLTSSTIEGHLRVPSNLIPSLKKIIIARCNELTFQGNKEGFSVFTSLEELTIELCPKLIPSLVVYKYENGDQGNGIWLLPCSLRELEVNGLDDSLETLQPCFPEDRNGLKKLQIDHSLNLESLDLRSCTALEELIVDGCKSLAALEDFRSLRGLRYLTVLGCPALAPFLECLLSQGYELCSGLERLCTDDYSFLTTSFCKCLTSLQCLELRDHTEKVMRLTDEQERALELLTSLQELRFCLCYYLADLPVGLHSLPSLKKLGIFDYPCISGLPEKGLPHSLEKLNIVYCLHDRNEKLIEQCRTLATSKLRPFSVEILWGVSRGEKEEFHGT